MQTSSKCSLLDNAPNYLVGCSVAVGCVIQKRPYSHAYVCISDMDMTAMWNICNLEKCLIENFLRVVYVCLGKKAFCVLI